MKKRTTIFGALLISTIVILIFFISVVLLLWLNQNFVTRDLSGGLSNFFSTISVWELFAIFTAAVIMTSIVLRYISLNIKSNFEKFNQYFLDAAYDDKLIDEDNLNFKEFETLANSVNYMVKRAKETKKKLEFNEKYLQTILDAQKNIVLVFSHGELERANQAFYNFMSIEDLDRFKKEYNCISDLFVEDKSDEYLTKSRDDISWINYILMNPSQIHKIKIIQNEEEIIFEVNAKVVDVDDNYKVVVTFYNISILEEQKKAYKIASLLDNLTQVSNRLKFNMILEQQIEMSKRYNHSFCLIFFDIDHFKKINDTYGHKIGDDILIELAMLVKKSMRKSDTFARWGGEEFAIILPQSRIKTAVKIAEKLRKKIAEHIFVEDIRVTCSFGVCEYKKSYDQQMLIKLVDQKLYMAKDNGRDQVQF